jgi:chemotaxis signal transduction protein
VTTDSVRDGRDGRVTALATAFDGSFARAPDSTESAEEDMLAIAIAGEPYAVRLAAIDELVSDRPVTRLVGAVPGLLGVAGLRGALIPVFDLAALLGRHDPVPPRWMVVTRGASPLALAFVHLDGHIRVPSAAIAADTSAGDRRHVRDVLRLGSELRPIVHLPSILDTLAAAVGDSQGATRR